MGGLLLTFIYQTWAYASLLKGTGLTRAGRWRRGVATAAGMYLLTLLSAVGLLVTVNWQQLSAYLQR